MTSEVPMLRLSNGVEMPALGFGTYAKEGKGETYKAVFTALETGYRHLDCAWYYENEDEVGAALKAWLAQNPSYNRSDIFITTKVWPHLMEPTDLEWSFNDSLKNLGVDYVDAFLIHWPFACERTEDRRVKLGSDGKYIVNETLTNDLSPSWNIMEDLYRSGRTRSIGVSNFTTTHLTTLLSHATVKPTINQIEIHPFLPNTHLVNFCFSNDISPVAYSPLGSQHQCPSTGEKVLENEVLKEIAKEQGVDVAQVCISWGLQKGWGVLPKSGRKERIERNFKTVVLSEGEVGRIDGIVEGRGGEKRFVNLREAFGFEVFDEE